MPRKTKRQYRKPTVAKETRQLRRAQARCDAWKAGQEAYARWRGTPVPRRRRREAMLALAKWNVSA